MADKHWAREAAALDTGNIGEGGDEVRAIAELAREGVRMETLEDGREVAIVPKDFKTMVLGGREDLPKPFTRIKARRTFHEAESFGRYVLRYKTSDSLMLADIDKGKIAGVIDYHGADSPQCGDHVAVLDLQPSEEWAAWDELEGELIEQGDFMMFLEQHAQDIIKPDQASMIELVRGFSVSSSVNFTSAKRLDNGDRKFVYQDETNVKGEIVVPDKIVLEIPLYRGEEAVHLHAYFRYRIRPSGLFLGIAWHRAYEVRDAAFKQAVTSAAEASGLQPFYGVVDV